VSAVTVNIRARTVILATACLGHVGLILLLLNGLDVVRRRLPAREPEPLLARLLDSVVRPQPPPAVLPPPIRPLPPPADAIAIPLPEIDALSSEGAPSPPVSDSVPRVDWIDERKREVAYVVAREAANAARARIGQHAKAMDLPHDQSGPGAGVVEHAAGGETIEWISDRCYLSNKRPIPRFMGFGIATCKKRAHEEIRLTGPRQSDE
jgi:hypothetical protein